MKRASSAMKNRLTAVTPERYAVTLCDLTLWNPTTDERHNVFHVESFADCPVFDFVPGQTATEDMLPPGSTLPDEAGFNVAEMGLIAMEMTLPFRIDGAIVERTLKIYYDTVPPFFPGDVQVVGPTPKWGFGPGNLVNDPDLTGLDRAEAYNESTWPRGDDMASWGPFGNAAFWQNHPPDPFMWRAPLPTDGQDEVVIVFEVADTWKFTDVNEDGVYDWPDDYGGSWHMEFPRVVGVPIIED